jgi:acetyltransferase
MTIIQAWPRIYFCRRLTLCGKGGFVDKLDAIFAPETIAVVGASTQKGKVGHDIFANILSNGYKGTLYPVNPKARSVLSVKCYTSITNIPDPIDRP